MTAQARPAPNVSLSLPLARYGLYVPLCLAVAVLLGWGLIMVASASVAVG